MLSTPCLLLLLLPPICHPIGVLWTLSPSVAQIPGAVGMGGQETCSGIWNFFSFIKATGLYTAYDITLPSGRGLHAVNCIMGSGQLWVLANCVAVHTKRGKSKR